MSSKIDSFRIVSVTVAEEKMGILDEKAIGFGQLSSSDCQTSKAGTILVIFATVLKNMGSTGIDRRCSWQVSMQGQGCCPLKRTSTRLNGENNYALAA